jgi:hypothetical protein
MRVWHISDVASEIEVKVKYLQLSRIYHPDNNNPAITGLTAEEEHNMQMRPKKLWQKFEIGIEIEIGIDPSWIHMPWSTCLTSVHKTKDKSFVTVTVTVFFTSLSYSTILT